RYTSFSKPRQRRSTAWRWRTAAVALGLSAGGCLLPEVELEQEVLELGGGGAPNVPAPDAGRVDAGAPPAPPQEPPPPGTLVCAPTCAAGEACATAADCESRVCEATGCAAGVSLCCQAPTCTDGVANGDEPVVDCGNVLCGLCPVDHACSADAQCASGRCVNGVCGSPCGDGVLNGTETDIDCGGADPTCARCAEGKACVA